MTRLTIGPTDKWLRAVVRVGAGRGFVVETKRERLVVTAAHCLPQLPAGYGAASADERTYAKLVGPLGTEPTVWAECVFVDPIADLAVLCSPDHQELPQQAEAYEGFLEAAVPLHVGTLTFKRTSHTLPDGTLLLGRPTAEGEAWLLSLDGRWFPCRLKRFGHTLCIEGASDGIRGGMSGSPIIAERGEAIGIVAVSGGAPGEISTSGGPNPLLSCQLPGWLLRDVKRQRPRQA